MGFLSQRASFWVLAVVGAGIAAGVAAGISSDPRQARTQPSPAEIVAMRFAGVDTMDIGPTAAVAGSAQPATPTAGYALASVDSATIFSPYPVYRSQANSAAAANPAPVNSQPVNSPPVRATSVPPTSVPAASASTASQTASQPAGRGPLPPQLATADDQIPASALAYAAPADEPAAAPAAAPKRPNPPPHPATSSNAVLNAAQIASIRERLKLSSYQDQLWPPVESALKDISYQHKGSGHATIDTTSASVQRLKSAAFPLIMSLSSEQKDEVRSMVRLMGLESLAAEF
jgi:hypothetical protein